MRAGSTWRTSRSGPPVERRPHVPHIDLYVDNIAGDDSLDGRSPSIGREGHTGPFRTISRALRIAGPDSRISLARTAKPYRESFTLVGRAHDRIVLEGNGAIIDGSLPVPPDAWEHFTDDIFRFRPRLMTYQQLLLNDLPLDRQTRTDGEPGLPYLSPLHWSLLDGYIYFRVPRDKVPRDLALSHCGSAVGITLYSVDGAAIHNLIVQGFQVDGVNAISNAFDCHFNKIICRGNGRSGISVSGSSRVTIDQCMLGKNGVTQLRTEGQSTTYVVASEFPGTTVPAWINEGKRLYIDRVEVKAGRGLPAALPRRN